MANPIHPPRAPLVDPGTGLVTREWYDFFAKLVRTVDSGVVTAGGGLALSGTTLSIANNGVTNARLRDSAGVSVIGRYENSTGDPADIVAGADDRVLMRSSGILGFFPLTTGASLSDGDFGDIVITGGGTVLSVDADAVGNTKLANMAQATFKGRAAGVGTGDPTDLTATQAWGVLATTTQTVTTSGLTIATDRLAGRDTAAAGAIEEITVGGGIEFTGAGGIQTSAFTGDVTKVAGGTATIIANDAVSFAKMADLAADRLIGRDTAGTGDPEAITVGGGLEFTGAGGVQRSALTGDVTASAGSGATTIANDAVTYAKMQNVSATDRLLGRQTAGAGDVEEITLTAAGRALLDDADAAAQRTTLGLGTAAVKNTGTSGNNVPLLDGANTWSAGQTLEQLTVSGASNFINLTGRTGGTDNFLLFADTNTLNFYSGAVRASLTSAGVFDVTGSYSVDGTQVVSNRGAAVADATDAASAITQLNAWLARARAHGLIAT